MKQPFYETTWAEVEAGDTVLFAWPERRRLRAPRIVKVDVERCEFAMVDEKRVVVARFKYDSLEYGRSFYPDETVYVQSRL